MQAQLSQKCNGGERFARAALDVLSKHVAVIDETGAIRIVNSAWRRFAVDNGAAASAVSEGVNYLEVCDSAAARGDEDAAEVAAIIRSVLKGEQDSGCCEYRCDAPDEERWFSVKVIRSPGDGPVSAVVVHENLTMRHKNETRIAFLATHDPLTELPNRTLFAERVEQALNRNAAASTEMALLFLDLDGFKFLNDAYGHMMGDEALKAFAKGLEALIGSRGIVARFGGDEFVVLLSGCKNAKSSAVEIANGILRLSSEPLILQGREVTVSASIGITIYPSDGRSLDQLLSNGDAAMYCAKQLGRNRSHFYSAEMSARASERMLIESELRRALRFGEFELHYQPQVCLTTGEILGMEALIRWCHPMMGYISPERFIPIAEQSGLIVPIGQWVLETACVQNAAWQAAGLRALPVAVNISALQVWQSDFVDLIDNILSHSGLAPHWLELEITEGVVMDRAETTIGRLHELKALGVGLSIDDFGTGYSNLGYLQSFPIDQIKIDRSFVRGLPHDANAVAVSSAIIGLGHNLGIRVVAEGVETPDEAAFLRAAGCQLAQGYLFAKPLPTTEMEEWLRKKPAQRSLMTANIA